MDTDMVTDIATNVDTDMDTDMDTHVDMEMDTDAWREHGHLGLLQNLSLLISDKIYNIPLGIRKCVWSNLFHPGGRKVGETARFGWRMPRIFHKWEPSPVLTKKHPLPGILDLHILCKLELCFSVGEKPM
jgi:hypothetical protein